MSEPFNQEILEGLWRISPAALASHLSKNEMNPWYAPKHLELMSRKIVEVVSGRLPRLIVTIPPRFGKPVSKNEMVLLGNGLRRPLADLTIGSRVITGKGRPRKVQAIFDQGMLDCVEVATKSGRKVVAALDHPFLAREAGVNGERMVAVGNLVPGDSLVMNNGYELDNPRLFEAHELRLMGYLCGISVQKDHLYIANHRGWGPEVDDIQQILLQLGVSSKRMLTDGLHVQGLVKWQYASQMVNERGIFKGKRIPQQVRTATREELLPLFAGAFSTLGLISDVSFRRKPLIAFTNDMVNVELLEDLRILLGRAGIASKINDDLEAKSLVISDLPSLVTFCEDVRPVSLQKQEQLNAMAAKLRAAGHERAGRYLYDEIVAVKEARADCACINVEEDGTFTANEFIVSNSELVSHWTPIWFIENWPHKRIILASYEADFAASWGRKSRDTILRYNENGTKQLRVRLDPNTQSVSHWLTTERGGMSTAGVGGPITGKGADLLIIDDPIKNFSEAASFSVRESLWNWYRSTARTRIEPRGGVIVTMTRWNENDLVGKLIKSMNDEGGEHWEVFNFPAVAEERDVLGREPGETLWPARYSAEDLRIIKGSVGTKIWNAMYQQKPGTDDEVGNVYYGFGFDNVAASDYDTTRPLIWAMDFNVDPMTAVIAQDYPGFRRDLSKSFIIDEIYLPNSNAFKMANEFASRVFKLTAGRQTVVEIYGDASGRQKSTSGDKSSWEIIRSVLEMYPFIIPQYRYKKHNPTIKERVNTVNTMLCAADGARRLFISPRCNELISDFKRISWDVDGDGNPTGQMDKSDPKRTHVSDALGYYITDKFRSNQAAGGRRGIMQ